MFRNSKIAGGFSFRNTKCSDIINFGIGPYFQSFLDQVLKEASYFVCSFDESDNSTIKKEQMGMTAQYWDNSTWSQKDPTTANYWEKRQLWMYTQNSNPVQSHLTEVK